MTMDQDSATTKLQRTLRTKNIDDKDYDRIKENFPLTGKCPTCDDAKEYTLNGKKVECDCETQKLLQKYYFQANIGREYHDICLEHFYPGPNRDRVAPVIEKYLDNFDDNFHYGLGLSFNGPLGTGKTFAMSCVLKELVKRGRQVYNITFDELIVAWGDAWKDEDSKRILYTKLKGAEVLGLDELRTDPRNKTGFLSGGLDAVIRHRTSNLLPTLVTSNLSLLEEEKEFGKAFSLLSARNERVIFFGEDERGGVVKDTIKELANGHERRPIC